MGSFIMIRKTADLVIVIWYMLNIIKRKVVTQRQGTRSISPVFTSDDYPKLIHYFNAFLTISLTCLTSIGPSGTCRGLSSYFAVILPGQHVRHPEAVCRVPYDRRRQGRDRPIDQEKVIDRFTETDYTWQTIYQVNVSTAMIASPANPAITVIHKIRGFSVRRRGNSIVSTNDTMIA